ncbi:MAG: XRE family transcriptional regulator [Spirochaetia bacterium]|jgi:transcriptional regulator with XRE-family HTH domain|nr:XRE family transcriptional regulator [Spirochaetia bacterium]
MNKIKEFRTQLRLTQKDLATLMNTTQQTIGRWENGTSEPSLSNLRDLAYKLGTTTSAILGEPFASTQSSHYHLMFKKEKDGLDGFWGNVGVLPAHRSKSIWYPITLENVCDASQKIGEGEPFMFESLNNKLVFVNPDQVKRLVTLDDAADAFPNDWEVSWLEFGYESPEIFDALEIYLHETYWGLTEDPENSLSDDLRSVVKKMVEEHKLDEEAILQLTSGIRIFYSDGSMETYTLSDFSSVAALYMELELNFIPPTVVIDDEFTISLPMASISVIEFPLAKVKEAMKEDLEDFDLLDDDDEEAVPEGE